MYSTKLFVNHSSSSLMKSDESKKRIQKHIGTEAHSERINGHPSGNNRPPQEIKEYFADVTHVFLM